VGVRGGEAYLWAGSDTPDEVAWTEENCGETTHPVAGKAANAFGLYDMSGNVA
jgi:formylglycine-generating enzyme required for sulfatase activity